MICPSDIMAPESNYFNPRKKISLSQNRRVEFLHSFKQFLFSLIGLDFQCYCHIFNEIHLFKNLCSYHCHQLTFQHNFRYLFTIGMQCQVLPQYSSTADLRCCSLLRPGPHGEGGVTTGGKT